MKADTSGLASAAPRISVCIPCYNSALYIARTIQSVQAQTVSDWEIVIVDDGSTDNPAVVVGPLAESDPRIRFIRQTNGGVCRARNRAYAASSRETKYILFLDADDTLQPEMLAKMSAYLDENSAVGMVYCEPRRIDAEDREVEHGESLSSRRWTLQNGQIARIAAEAPETPFSSLFAWNGITPSVTLIRRSVYNRTPGFDEVFGQHFEDTDVFFSIAMLAPVHYLSDRLVNYRVHGSQAATQQAALWAKERKLYWKWLESVKGRTPEEKQRIVDAWKFRERVLMPRLRFRWAVESAQKGHLPEALRQLLRAVKHLRTYYQGRPLLSRTANGAGV